MTAPVDVLAVPTGDCWIVEEGTNTISAPPTGRNRYREPVAYLHGIDAAERAARIVACVNACAGIPTDALETMPLDQAAKGVWQ